MSSSLKSKFNSSSLVANYRKMWTYIKPYKTRAILSILATIPVGAMDAVIALALKPFTDATLVAKSTSTVIYIPIIIIAFSLFQSLLNYAATYLNTWVGRKIANDLKSVLFSKLMTYSASFFDKRSSGDIMVRFNGDVDLACNGLITNLKIFTTRVISSIALICVLFYNSWQLAIVAVIFLLLALYPITTVKKRIKSIVDKSIFSGAAIATHYNESYSGNRVITSYNLQKDRKKKFDERLRIVFNLGIKMVQRMGIMSPLMHFIVSLGIAAVIWQGSSLITSGTITAGNFVSFIAALLMLYTPIKGIGNNYNAVITSLMAMERVFGLLEMEPEVVNKKELKKLDKNIKIGIEYKNVNFEYSNGVKTLKNINFKINSGETIALVGNSGGGKTTFVNLLPRFYDVTSGSITIDEVDIRDFDLYDLREQIAIVFQDNFLFSGTIKENIILGNEEANDEDLKVAVDSACLREFIDSLENGIDTDIGERGVLLSGGQKQRIAIARAFLKNAPIVILDEATSALDNKSEAVVQLAIENLMKSRTVFVIAHRLSTVKNADKIVVINDGKIVETGTHQELLDDKQSAYSSLYKTQFNLTKLSMKS